MSAFKSCRLCRLLPGHHATSFLEAGRAEVPSDFLVLHGWTGHDLSSGYQKFKVHCPECATQFLVEVDVEPFVWDFTVTRLAGDAKHYQGLYG